MNNLLNNRGITLVELLAALALVGIIATVAGSLVTQTYQSNSKVQNEIDLKQQTNSILTIIREQITEENMEICLVDRDTLRLDDDGEAPYLYPNLITKEQMTISELYIENMNNAPKANRTLDIKPSSDINEVKCIITNSFPTKIKINSTTKNDSQSYKVNTIVTKRSHVEGISLPDNGNSDGSDNQALVPFTTFEEFHSILENKEVEFNLDHPDGTQNKCEFEENIRLNDSSVLAPWTFHCDPTTFNQSLWSDYKFTMNFNTNQTNLFVMNNMYLDEESIFYNGSDSIIKGNSYFNKKSTLYTDSSITFFNGYFSKGILMENSSNIFAKGSLRLDSSSLIKANSAINVSGSTFVRGNLKLQENTTLKSKGNIIVEGETTLHRGNEYLRSTVYSSQDITFDGKVNIQKNTYIGAKGDITFTKQVSPRYEEALICSEGEIFGKQHIPKEVIVKQGSCPTP